MKTSQKRATVYFDPDLHRALRLKSAETERSMSELVNEAVKLGLADDPRPRGYEKLSGQNKYRLRQGSYRILYEIRDQDLLVFVSRWGTARRFAGPEFASKDLKET